MNEITIILVLYLVQILAMLLVPYYYYRKDYNGTKDNRTIDNFVYYIKETCGEWYLSATFIPIIGITFILLVLIVGFLCVGGQCIYDKFIKNIRI